LFIVYLIISIFVSFLISRKLGLYPVRVHFDDEIIKFQYLTRDLNRVRDEIKIATKNIIGFSDFAFGGHDVFKLKLNSGRTFEHYKNGLFRKSDDFDILNSDFKIFIDDYNSKNANLQHENKELKAIKYKDFLLTRNASFLFYLAIALILWITYWEYSGKSSSTSGSILVIGAMVGYIGLYLSKRNTNRNDR